MPAISPARTSSSTAACFPRTFECRRHSQGEATTMKLLRYGPKGREKPGLLDKDGIIRDLSGIIPDITPATLAAGAIAKVKKAKPETLPAVEGRAHRLLRRPGPQLHRHRPQLCRPRHRDELADPGGADHLQQGAELHLRAERRRDDPEGLRRRPTGRSSSPSSSARRGSYIAEGRASTMSPATRSATTSPSAPSRRNAAASG